MVWLAVAEAEIDRPQIDAQGQKRISGAIDDVITSAPGDRTRVEAQVPRRRARRAR